MLPGFAADVKLAARRLLATPLFAIFAVLSLAIGVSVTTAVYSIVESIFLKDLGIVAPERLAFVVRPFDGRTPKASLSLPDFLDLRDAQRSFSAISASSALYPAVGSQSTTELLPIEAVDDDYFATFDIHAVVGRTLQAADASSNPAVAVISHWLWRTRYASNPQVVGQTLRVAGQPFDVVGVVEPGFDGVNVMPATRVWIPLAAEAFLSPPRDAIAKGTPRDEHRLIVFGRLRPAVTIDTASAELTAIAQGLDVTFPPQPEAVRRGAADRRWRAKSAAALSEENNPLRRFGLTLVALVALVLVVASTNLANLVLARGTIRQQEITIRRALGASRVRLVREQCAESLLLALAGGGAAYLAFQALRVAIDTEFSLPLPMGGRVTFAIHPVLDETVLAIAVVCLLLSLVVFGLEPALQLTRTRDIRGELSAGGGVGRPKVKRQRMLLRWQVAISAGFFIVATLFIQYTVKELTHDTGIEMQRLGIAVLNLRAQGWDEQRVRRALDRVTAEAGTDSSIVSLAISNGMPFGTVLATRLALSLPEQVLVDRNTYNAAGMTATPSIFATLGVPIVRGRGFDNRDDSGPPVVVVSEFTARTMFGPSDPLGRRVVVQRPNSPMVIATVIGVARDTDVGRVFGEPRPFVYMPLQYSDPLLTVSVRSSTGAAQAVTALRDALRRADPDLAIDVIGPGRLVLTGQFVFLRSAGISAVVLGVLTLALSMMGLFGIQSHVVTQRTREIGLRMSIGATASEIRRMVLAEGFRPVFDGLVIGLFGGFAGRVIVRAYLEIDVDIFDPWALLVAIPLVFAAFCACYGPAHRAAAVDPNSALRHV